MDWDADTNVTHESEVPAPRATVRDRASLVVLAGPRVGTLFRIESDELNIGRSLRAEICVDDDGVSRMHARIVRQDDGFFLDDLRSRNGTYVNGVRVVAPVRLTDGDKIHVGRGSILKFAYHDALDDSFQARMVDSALRDPLTRLYNQRYFAERLDAELRFARRHGSELAVLMIDIDHFKDVNDRRGHLVGDSVLTAVALNLARAVRNEDVVARHGGEEFVVLLRATSIDAAVLLAERLRKKVEDAPTPCEGGPPVLVTISIGAAAFPGDGLETAHDLLGAADRALYAAKQAGRNRVAR